MARLRMLDDNHAAGSHEFRHYGVNSWGESSHKQGGVSKAQEISSDPFFPSVFLNMTASSRKDIEHSAGQEAE